MIDMKNKNNSIQRLNRTESIWIREQFIKKYVDVSTSHYEKISKINCEVCKDRQDYVFLWDALYQEFQTTVNYHKALEFLSKYDGEVYVMVDLCFIVNNENAGEEDILRMKRDLKGDSILRLDACHVADIIRDDNSSSQMYSDRQFPADIYVFDSTFKWFIAFTHEFFGKSYEDADRICYCNIGVSM